MICVHKKLNQSKVRSACTVKYSRYNLGVLIVRPRSLYCCFCRLYCCFVDPNVVEKSMMDNRKKDFKKLGFNKKVLYKLACLNLVYIIFFLFTVQSHGLILQFKNTYIQ